MPVTNLKLLKKELRAKHRKIRQTCPADIKNKLDERIFERFIDLDNYKKADTVLMYMSGKIEVNTQKILEKAFSDGKRVAVPKCLDDKGSMEFYYITSADQLTSGFYNIMEPDETCEMVTDLSKGLCIVPALCVDLYGYRIGFGKGYYDRFLDRFKGTTVALCYSKCVEQEIPKSLHDKAVDILITEKYTSVINKTTLKD